jgi:hypothetical protein
MRTKRLEDFKVAPSVYLIGGRIHYVSQEKKSKSIDSGANVIFSQARPIVTKD